MILILHGYKNTSETQLVAIRKPNLWYFSFSCHLLSFLYEARKIMYFISLTDIKENWESIFWYVKAPTTAVTDYEKAQSRVKHEVYGNCLAD